MAGFIRSVSGAGGWKTVTSYFIRTASGAGGWKTVTDGWIRVADGAGGWRRFFASAVTPSIASTVTISTSSSSYPATLTGTNFNWTNSTSLTYVFQKSSDNVTFTDIGVAQSISNPAVSNTVTYALTLSDFPAFTSYFRFVVTAVNSTYSTSATSTSTSVTVNKGAPINTVAPVISPTSGTAGVTTYSVTSNGTWDPDDSDGIYSYQWQSFDTPTYVTAPGSSTSSSYTPPSNFFTLGYSSPIRCRVTATNSAGSTNAFSNSATVSSPVPAGGTVTLSPSGTQLAGTTLTASTSGWSNSPTSYNVRIYASTTNPPTTSDILKASSSGSSSVTYTITTLDATAPAYYFKAFATATNASGTSTEVGSNVVLSALPSPPVNTVAPVVTPSSGTAGTTTYSCTTGTWTNSPTSYAYQWQYNDGGSTYLTISGATSSTYSPPSNFFSGLFYNSPIRCRVTASNAGGSNQAFSNTATVAAPLSPPSGGSVTLSGTGVAGTSITATTSGWSNSPTSYSVRIYASTSNPPTTSDTLKASSSTSSVSYTVTTFDASPPPYYFKAFATATNAAGTSSEVGSNVILSSLGAPSTPGTPTLTYDASGTTATNYNYDADWSDSTGSGTIVYQLDCQPSTDGISPNGQPSLTRPSSGTYSTSDAQNFLLPKVTGGVSNLYWRVRARASNDGGSTWSSYSGYSTYQ